jgi:hypothetical protein
MMLDSASTYNQQVTDGASRARAQLDDLTRKAEAGLLSAQEHAEWVAAGERVERFGPQLAEAQARVLVASENEATLRGMVVTVVYRAIE